MGMRCKLTIFAFAALIFSSANSFASGYLTPYGTGVPVEKIHFHSNGAITLWVSNLNNPDACDSVSLVHIKATHPAIDKMTSAALAAYLSGKKIGLWTNYPCEVIPFWGNGVTRPIISDLWITD